MKFLTLILLGLGLGYTSSALHCSQGEVPDSNMICIQPQYIEGCYAYASKQTCSQCIFRYRLNDNKLCQFQDFQSGPCCLESNNHGQCTKCNVGLYLNSDKVCQQSTIIGCLEKSSQGKCVNCAYDFILASNGQCQKGIKGCQQYVERPQNSQKICEACKVGFSLINNSCLKNKILGCYSEQKHVCSACYPPFKPRLDHCEIENCVTYNDYGCTSCDCGFYLTQKNTCEELHKGCIRYQRGICTDCHMNFKLKGASCIFEGCQQIQGLSCLSCEEKYELKDGKCKLENCLEWNDGNCHVCEEKYQYFNGGCVKAEEIGELRPL